MPWPVVTGSALASMRPAWWRTPSARAAGWPTRQRRIGLWECEHNKSLDLPPMPPAISTYGNAESCPALWIRGLVPGQFLHYFPVPEGNTALWLQGGSHRRRHHSPSRRALVSGIWGCFGRPLRNRHAIPASRHSRNHYGFPRERLDRH